MMSFLHQGNLLASKILLAGILILFCSVSTRVRAEGTGEDPKHAKDDELEQEFMLLDEDFAPNEVVSASKHSQPLLLSPSAVSIYTRDEIRRSGAQTLADFLRRVPGFDVYQADALWSFFGARGFAAQSNNRVLFLIDGRDALFEIMGYPMWGCSNIDLESIERIEVIRGPGSALYGANAFSAVVSITTAMEKTSGAESKLSFGHRNHRHLVARAHGAAEVGSGMLRSTLTLSHRSATTVTDPADAPRIDGYAHGLLRYNVPGTLDVSLHGGYTLGNIWVYAPFGETRLKDSETGYVMAKAAYRLNERIKLSGQLYSFFGHFDTYFRVRIHAFDLWIADLRRFRLNSASVDLQFQLDAQILDRLMLIGGLFLRRTTVSTEELDPVTAAELRGAGFAHLEWRPAESLQVVAGLRLDLNSVTEPALSPRAAVVLAPWRDHSFRLGFGMAFRKPFFLEHTMHFRFDYNPLIEGVLEYYGITEKLEQSAGNPAVQNERVQSIELGYRGFFLDRRLRIGCELFYNRYLDSIYVEIASMTGEIEDMLELEGPVFGFKTHQKAFAALGGEFEVALSWSDTWNVWANLSLRTVVEESSFERLDSEPIVKANLGGGYAEEEGMIVDLALHATSAYRSSQIDPRLLTEMSRDLGNWALLIGRLGYRLKLPSGATVETGILAKIPIGPHQREIAGTPVDKEFLDPDDPSGKDSGGDPIDPLLHVYLRARM